MFDLRDPLPRAEVLDERPIVGAARPLRVRRQVGEVGVDRVAGHLDLRRRERPTDADRPIAPVVALDPHRLIVAGSTLPAGRRRRQQTARTAGYGLTAAPPPGWISKWRWLTPALPGRAHVADDLTLADRAARALPRTEVGVEVLRPVVAAQPDRVAAEPRRLEVDASRHDRHERRAARRHHVDALVAAPTRPRCPPRVGERRRARDRARHPVAGRRRRQRRRRRVIDG